MTSGEYNIFNRRHRHHLLVDPIFIKIMKCFWYPLQKHNKMLFLVKSFWGLTQASIVLADLFMFKIL
ncbi:unnamed protein product [Acanthoscelides obtectus]|uniref:Uncharacterized protein n=1 Tax=Acanthoscelides obtectus TaxID=200917 RepID=A0A9P0KAA8_ACAOB|nr:unnamed protein product [Acanthoscelides obtectus]CAK1652314.1 hypothetical protein AOBTE_LOCUS17780 [Acanthoscelides obtectus]